ncbi:cob(I)yrinic acid a,c-diamide adenosyltransferase [Candidatus Peregrinibacteria bacterium]|nr:cob(I)yrinic acid a,c-diamide adenosyltransferase [Candidatus Peregrinibacteria bacterium]
MRPSLSTATGDDGTTGLYGGTRIAKDDVRIHAYGTVDELNACIGMVLAEPALPVRLRGQLTQAQSLLFTLGADLATPEDHPHMLRITALDVSRVEAWGVMLEQDLPRLRHFILPGGSRAGACLHLARTVCRRAERYMVALDTCQPVNAHAMIFMNRLSDYLFLAARACNAAEGVEETEWVSGA